MAFYFGVPGIYRQMLFKETNNVHRENSFRSNLTASYVLVYPVVFHSNEFHFQLQETVILVLWKPRCRSGALSLGVGTR